MTPAEVLSSDLADAAQALRAKDQPFAFATIVRTAGATAAKPGAKALIGADGAILQGWLGGGCTRSAVKKATLQALQSGQPQLISVTPEDALAERGVAPGTEVEGVTFARNGCPSKGTIDVFIEPCLPMPELLIFGASPVAKALATQASQFHWAVVTQPESVAPSNRKQRAIIVATQGQGDLDALQQAIAAQPQSIGFVGSRRKFAALRDKLIKLGADPITLDRVKAPVGLDIGAVTPEEIALSILAELTQWRRRGVAHQDAGTETEDRL